MAPKPTFKIKLSKGDQENGSPSSLATTTWALAGSEAEGRFQAKVKAAKHGGFNISIVRKSHLRDWNFNICNIKEDGTLHTTSFGHRVSPAPQSPTEVLSKESLASNTVERNGWMGCQPPFPLLLSPIWQREAPSPEDIDATNALLSLSASSCPDKRITVNDEMLVDSDAQSF